MKLFIWRRNAVHTNHFEDFKIHNSLVYFYYLIRVMNKPAIFYFFLFSLKKRKSKNNFAKYIIFYSFTHTFSVLVFLAKMNYSFKVCFVLTIVRIIDNYANRCLATFLISFCSLRRTLCYTNKKKRRVNFNVCLVKVF